MEQKRKGGGEELWAREALSTTLLSFTCSLLRHSLDSFLNDGDEHHLPGVTTSFCLTDKPTLFPLFENLGVPILGALPSPQGSPVRQ